MEMPNKPYTSRYYIWLMYSLFKSLSKVKDNKGLLIFNRLRFKLRIQIMLFIFRISYGIYQHDLLCQQHVVYR